MSRRVLVLALFSLIMLSACNSKPYNLDAAIERGDIVDVHGNVKNSERLEEFYQNTLNNNKDKIRIIQLTIEGDPIFNDLEYDGKEIIYRYDNSEDKFGKSDVRTTTCKSLITSKIQTGNEYRLEGCYGNNKEIGDRFMIAVSRQ